MHVRQTILLGLLVAGLLGPLGALPGAHGEDEPSAELALTTERAVIFKDGYGLVARHARGHSNAEGEVFTHEVPDAAVLGSFWAVAGEDAGRLLSMDAGIVRHTKVESTEETAAYMGQMLAWNVDRVVRLELLEGDPIAGRIVSVTGTAGQEILVVDTGRGKVALLAALVRRIHSEDLAVVRTTEQQTEVAEKRLTFRFDGGAAPRDLSMMYFRPGLRWIPTYRIHIPEDDGAQTARISLQAELLSEAEDLVDVPLDLVVGVPNFRFREVVSPFVLERALRNALHEAAPQLMGQMASNAYFSNRAGERHRRDPSPSMGGGDVELPPELAAASSQDLFLYSLPPTTLRKGHRVAVPIFDATAPLRHVYTWDVAVARHDVALSPGGGQGVSPLRISPDLVWHQVELANGTDVPWTTGAAMLVQKGRPLAQELLTYTPRGGSVRVPVTVAVDVRGSYREEEVERALGALRWGRYDYARIDARGALEVVNYKQTPIDLEVTLRIGGRVDEASAGSDVRIEPFRSTDWKDYRGDPSVNNSSLVTFRLHLEPGEKAEPWVQCHYFLRQ